MPQNFKSKFLKINCPKCNKEQIVFGKSSMKINCVKCNKRLLKTQGGKVKIKARIEKILWN